MIAFHLRSNMMKAVALCVLLVLCLTISSFGQPSSPTPAPCPQPVPILEPTKTIAAVIGWIGTVAAILLFLSPIPTFVVVVKARDTKEFSCIPFLMAFTQCSIWVVYVVAADSGDLIQPLVTNCSGVVLEFVYIVIFGICLNSNYNVRVQYLLGVTISGIVGTGIVVLIWFLTPDHCDRPTYLGIVADIANVFMYAGPLIAIRVVWQTKSVEYLPLPMILATLFCSLSWFIYGTLLQNWFILAPNALGLLCGFFQIGLYCYIWFGFEKSRGYQQPLLESKSVI